MRYGIERYFFSGSYTEDRKFYTSRNVVHRRQTLAKTFLTENQLFAFSSITIHIIVV